MKIDRSKLFIIIIFVVFFVFFLLFIIDISKENILKKNFCLEKGGEYSRSGFNPICVFIDDNDKATELYRIGKLNGRYYLLD